MEEDPDDYAWLEAEAGMEEDPITVSLGPMGSLFQQLRSAIAWEYRRLKGVKAEIQILGQGLEGLCTDLKDLSEGAGEDTITRCWVRQVRDLCYDASDYLDELTHFIHCSSGTRPRTRLSLENRLGSNIFRVSRRPPACNQLRHSLPKAKKHLKRVHLIAKLSALVARVEDADARRTRFKISQPQASKHDDAQAQAAGVSHPVPQRRIQLHVDNLIKQLGFDERNLMLATSIFGSAGAGKTAVARSLYHQCRRRFQCRAFLRVSRYPDMRRLLADLLSQIKAPPFHALSDVQGLIATTSKHLRGKSYLIVLDDLWDTSTWNIISRALPDGDYCRIITTTQIEDVALACCSDPLKHRYEIAPLHDDQLGISEGGCTYPSTEGMKKALNLLYNNLPPHLKTCLLYLNMYPEGYTMRKDELVKQWVAEGLIGSVEGQDTEDTAGRYLDALVSTGMVQSVDTNHNDEVLSCTIHHMVLDLIRQKSMEENFVTIVNYFQTIIGLPDKVRRLSVQLGGAKGANNISGNMRISQVRSLLFCGFFKSVPSIMEYGLLQVLILLIWSDRDRIFDLTTIGELYRLRYLKIECSIMVKLPDKIGRLRQLGTLQVEARLYAVPSDLIHLEKLMHLRLRSESILPHGVGRMTCLRTLGYFDLGCNSEDNVRDLGELENLQNLQLTCSAVQQAESLEKNVQLLLGSVLKKLSMLQSVTLVPAEGSSNVNTTQDGSGASNMIISCDGSSSVFTAPAHLQRFEMSHRCCIFSTLPKWLGELTQLCILKIAVGELSKEDIGIMNGLPALASLSLHVSTRSREKIVFGKEGFSVLRYFKFTCTEPWMKFEAGAMPNLEKLKLCFCLPIQIIIIERLPALKEISAIIGSAGVDAESVWREAIKNDPGNPKVQLMGSFYYGDKGRGTETCQGSGEDAVIRVRMQPESPRLPVPAVRWEEEPEHRPFISKIISTPSESDSTDGHTGQVAIQRLPRMGDELVLREERLADLSLLQKTMNDLFQERKIGQGRFGSGMEYLSKKMSSSDPQAIKLHLLKAITDDFSEKMSIGKGGYGEVYRGVLNGDEIAVKKLFPVRGVDDEAFENEFRNIKKVQHKNVIRMIGYCYEIAHRDVEYEGKLVWSQFIDRAICFEFMKGGSLADHISAESCIHDWSKTYKIISETCEGLHHLHKGGEQQIFHLDLKPENILLDEELVPKIGDFGLSRLFGTSYTHQISTMKGTIEFMPPEYIHKHTVSPKNDVFSLGVIIFHMMAGVKGYGDYWDARRRPNFSPIIQQDFIKSVQEYWKTKMEATMSYRWVETNVLGVMKCIEMAMRCVEDDRDRRPSITEILGELKELDYMMEEMLKENPKPLALQLKGKNHVNDFDELKPKKSPNDFGKDIVVDPSLELRFPFEPKRDVSCCLQLINKADSFIAFNIKIEPNKYHAQPNSGVLSPCSKCTIILTLRAQKKAPANMVCHDMAILQSTRVPEGFSSDKITQEFFKKATSVDVEMLPIVYVALHKLLQE